MFPVFIKASPFQIISIPPTSELHNTMYLVKCFHYKLYVRLFNQFSILNTHKSNNWKISRFQERDILNLLERVPIYVSTRGFEVLRREMSGSDDACTVLLLHISFSPTSQAGRDNTRRGKHLTRIHHRENRRRSAMDGTREHGEQKTEEPVGSWQTVEWLPTKENGCRQTQRNYLTG